MWVHKECLPWYFGDWHWRRLPNLYYARLTLIVSTAHLVSNIYKDLYTLWGIGPAILPVDNARRDGVGHSLTLDGTASDYQQRGAGEGNNHPTTLFVLLSTTWSSKSIIITSVTNVFFTADSHRHNTEPSSHSAIVMMMNNIITLIIIYSFPPS